MAKSLIESAKEQGLRLDRRGYPRTLGRLFPADNTYSPAMWRLAIIRDDIDREIEGMALPPDSDDDRVWEHAYFLRRLSVSVLEATLHAQLDEVAKLLEPLRDGLGGHVRPNSANPERATAEVTYDVRGLRTHANWEATITPNKTSALGTSYREFTKMALLFVWPEVTDDTSMMSKFDDFVPAVNKITIDLLFAIDGVLFAFWLDIGAMEPMR